MMTDVVKFSLIACAIGAGSALARGTDAPDLARTVELADVVRLAASRNADARAAEARYRAATRRRPQVTALPDPKLLYTDWVQQMTPDFERWSVELSQDLPLLRKRHLAGRVADQEAGIAYLKYQVAVRNAIAEAKDAYFELYYIDRAQTITGKIRTLYDRYAALAAGGIQPGTASLPEAFRAESQRAQAGYDAIQLETMRRTESARLRSVLGIREKITLGWTAEVPEPMGAPPRLADLERLSLEYSQELASASLEIDKAHDELRIAKLARVPDFMVGTRYSRTGDVDAFGQPAVTKDPIMVMAGLNLPLWASKNRARVAEARDLEEAARADAEARTLDLQASLAKAHYGLVTSLRLVRLYRETLLPQARQALSSAEALARAGDGGMLGVIETTATVHNFELAALRARVDAYQNIARIERLVGTALPIARTAAGESSPASQDAAAPTAAERED